MAESGVSLIDDYLAKLRKGLSGLPDCDDSVAEAEDHLREAADAFVRAGMNEPDAERAALRQFGSASLVSHAHVVDHRKGAAVATTFTRYSGLAGAALVPLAIAAVAVSNLGVDGQPGRSVPGLLALAAVVAFVVGFLGLAARHRNALGGWGRAAKIILYLSVPLSIPFGWVAAFAFAAWLAVAGALLAVGMFAIGVLPRLPLAALAAAPLLALATLGIGTLAGHDMGQSLGNAVWLAALAVISASIAWLGVVMWREPAVNRRNTGPFAAA